MILAQSLAEYGTLDSFADTVGRFPEAARNLLGEVPGSAWLIAAAVVGVALFLYQAGRS